MADFRRWFIALAVLALMAGAASAQVGVANGTATSVLACVAAAAGTPELRPEGYTELAGDILISCTGGPDYQVGANIPTTNVTVYLQPSVPVTSRLIGSGSEALLIIDEAGSNITTGAVGSYGPNAPQVLCTVANEHASGPTSGPCTLQVGRDNGGTGNYLVAVGGSGNTNGVGGAAQNVFQGSVGDLGTNTVTFYNVPVLPPATNGVSRTFRIVNVRVPVPGILTAANANVNVLISTSPNQVLPVTFQNIIAGVVGYPTLAAVIPQKSAFQQCVATTQPQLTANLVFTEGFATAFKTRVVPGGASNGVPGNGTGNAKWAAEGTNLGPTVNNQNIPGGLYGGFAANSESGFILPGLVTTNTGTNAINYVAGLADYGTRLKAVFTNVPAGLTLYVSTTSGGYGSNTAAVPNPPGGTSVNSYAVLVANATGEATPDGSSFAPTTGPVTGSDNLNAIALSPNSNNQYIAVWEVVNSSPSAFDWLSFSVYIQYAPTSATSANPYGLPITDLPIGSPVNNVALSMAPEPGGGTFSAANASIGQTPVPRFAIVQPYQGRWTTIGLCQTTLLYPFVSNIAPFDTGIAVANTSMDPFGTVNQTGSCKLYGYGITATSTGATTVQTTVPGCDAISNPVPGTNCFGGATGGNFIAPGTVGTVMASSVLTGFQGYVIAVCNFQYAHGYAAVTDVGLHNLFSSYLALELSAASAYGSPRKGVSGIEALDH